MSYFKYGSIRFTTNRSYLMLLLFGYGKIVHYQEITAWINSAPIKSAARLLQNPVYNSATVGEDTFTI